MGENKDRGRVMAQQPLTEEESLSILQKAIASLIKDRQETGCFTRVLLHANALW